MQKTLIATALLVICSLLVTIKPTSSTACECSFTTLCESSWEKPLCEGTCRGCNTNACSCQFTTNCEVNNTLLYLDSILGMSWKINCRHLGENHFVQELAEDAIQMLYCSCQFTTNCEVNNTLLYLDSILGMSWKINCRHLGENHFVRELAQDVGATIMTQKLRIRNQPNPGISKELVIGMQGVETFPNS